MDSWRHPSAFRRPSSSAAARRASRPGITSPDAACASSILEEGDRVGDSWRSRWDGLRLFTPARFDPLPGMPFPAPAARPPDQRRGRRLPRVVRGRHGPAGPNRRSWSLGSAQRRWRRLPASPRAITASRRPQVVVAIGAYQQPQMSRVRRRAASTIRQLHSSDYRNDSPAARRPRPRRGRQQLGRGDRHGRSRRPSDDPVWPGQGQDADPTRESTRPGSSTRSSGSSSTAWRRSTRRSAGKPARTYAITVGRSSGSGRPTSRQRASIVSTPGRSASSRAPRARRRPNSRRDECRLVHRLPARLRLDPPARHWRRWLAEAGQRGRPRRAGPLLRRTSVPLFGCLGAARWRRQGCCLYRRPNCREDERVAGAT